MKFNAKSGRDRSSFYGRPAQATGGGDGDDSRLEFFKKRFVRPRRKRGRRRKTGLEFFIKRFVRPSNNREDGGSDAIRRRPFFLRSAQATRGGGGSAAIAERQLCDPKIPHLLPTLFPLGILLQLTWC